MTRQPDPSPSGNLFEDDPALRASLRFYWGAELYAEREGELRRFGAAAAKLEGHSEAARLIHESGILALHSEPGNSVEQFALLYLASQRAQARDVIPLAAATAAMKALARDDSDDLRYRYMGGLLHSKYDLALRSAIVRSPAQTQIDARPAGEEENSWVLTGGHLPCANPDADLILLKAPQGFFLIPRVLENEQPNGMVVCELGSGLPSVRLENAAAYRLGAFEDSERNWRETVETPLRLYGVVVRAGMMRRLGGAVARNSNLSSVVPEFIGSTLAGAFYLAYLDDLIEVGLALKEGLIFVHLMSAILSLAARIRVNQILELVKQSKSLEGGMDSGMIEMFLAGIRELDQTEGDIQRLAADARAQLCIPPAAKLCAHYLHKLIEEMRSRPAAPPMENIDLQCARLMSWLDGFAQNPSVFSETAVVEPLREAGELFGWVCFCSEGGACEA
ncbi:hypothetical protein HYR69_08890 [Candidatus Sumerlaeota bacterium]|nr:hypothetical protein [Candidatus Sumerlaeota bacterium]